MDRDSRSSTRASGRRAPRRSTKISPSPPGAQRGSCPRAQPVTALTHSAGKTGELEALGAKVAVGSFEDAASLERAFAGADTLVLITAANEHAAEQTLTAIDAAKRAKLRKIVRVSALHANVDGPTDNTRQHGRTEAALRASGLTFVILRPHLFMQSLLGSLQTILGKGQIYAGVGDGKMGMVDTRDVSDAAIVAASSDAFDGETLELTTGSRTR